MSGGETVVTCVGDYYLVKGIYGGLVRNVGVLWTSALYVFHKDATPSIPPFLIDVEGRRIGLMEVTNPTSAEILAWALKDGKSSLAVSTEAMRKILIALSQEESNDEGSQVSLNSEDQVDRTN